MNLLKVGGKGATILYVGPLDIETKPSKIYILIAKPGEEGKLYQNCKESDMIERCIAYKTYLMLRDKFNPTLYITRSDKYIHEEDIKDNYTYEKISIRNNIQKIISIREDDFFTDFLGLQLNKDYIKFGVNFVFFYSEFERRKYMKRKKFITDTKQIVEDGVFEKGGIEKEPEYERIAQMLNKTPVHRIDRTLKAMIDSILNGSNEDDSLIEVYNRSTNVDKYHMIMYLFESFVAKHCADSTLTDFNDVFETFVKTRGIFSIDNDSIEKILLAFEVLATINPDDIPRKYVILYRENIKDALYSIKMHMETINKILTDIQGSECENAVNIEAALFKMAFTFQKDDDEELGYRFIIYPVYLKHHEFVFPSDYYIIFKSSTGSGKTRCSPFFFSLINSFEHNIRPFFIMTQPSSAIAKEKVHDLQSMINNDVIICSSPQKMINLYQSSRINKTVIGIFSPINVLKIISKMEETGINIFEKTRFCLDEIHERSIETDALLSKISENTVNRNCFPAQVLLMSATPDQKVLNCFRIVKQISIEDTFLFHIDTKSMSINKPSEAPQYVCRAIYDTINDIVNEDLEHGHILSFLPGNSMINEVISMITKNYKGDNHFRVLNNFINDSDKYNDVIKRLRNEIRESPRKILLLPIKCTGYVSYDQKKIAQRPFNKSMDSHIIKIICATNAVESSITIDNLAAVIDSGLHNSPTFDIERGITELNIEQITEKMQTQRKGRVGRTRPGRVVQITLKGKKLPQDIPPAILTSDLSVSMIALRGIGINLEDLTRLPDNPGYSKFEATKRQLTKIGILDRYGNLTNLGKKTAEFQSINPQYAAAILSVVDDYRDIEPQFIKCLGALVVFIMTSTNLIGNPKSPFLQKNFNADSDVVTITQTFIDCVINEKKKESLAIKYGFQLASYSIIKQSMKNIFRNLLSDDERKMFWDVINRFLKRCDLYEFVNKIIKCIISTNSEWYEAHSAQFQVITGIPNNSRYVYTGDSSLSFDESGPNIILSVRPGYKGLYTPMKVIVFGIQRNKSMQKNYGEIIHSWEKSNNQINAPVIIELDNLVYMSDFFKVLIEQYLYEEVQDNKFIMMSTNDNIASGNAGEVFYISNWLEKVIVSFIPKTFSAKEEVSKAIKVSSALLPFVGRSVLIENNVPRCAIEVLWYGAQNYTTKLHMLLNPVTLPKCFNISKNIMNFLYERKLKELASSDNIYRLAITGESMSYSLDSHETSQDRYLTAKRSCKTVFGRNREKNRIILMIENGEEMPPFDKETIKVWKMPSRDWQPPDNWNPPRHFRPPNDWNPPSYWKLPEGWRSASDWKPPKYEIPLDWIEKGQTAEYVDFDYFVHVTGRVAPGIIFSSHQKDRFVLNNASNLTEMDNGRRINIMSLKDLIEDLSSDYASGHKLTEKLPYKSATFSPPTCSNESSKRCNERLKELLKGNGINANIYQKFGCTFIDTETQISSDKAESTKNIIKSCATSGGFSFRIVEHIPIMTLVVNLRSTSKNHTPVFERKIQEVVDRFKLVCYQYKFREEDNKKREKKNIRQSFKKGSITIEVMDPTFAIAIAGEIKEKIVGNNVIFKIPEKYVPRSLLNSKYITKEIDNDIKIWLRKEGLKSISKEGNYYTGTKEDVDRAYKILENKNKAIKVSYVFINIPPTVSDVDAMNIVRSQNRSKSKEDKWFYSKYDNGIIVKKEDAESAKKLLKRKEKKEDDDVIACVEYCDEPELSSRFVSIFNEDGSIETHRACLHCIFNMFDISISRYFNSANEIDFNEIMSITDKPGTMFAIVDDGENEDHEFWPKVPLGQVLWVLSKESSTSRISKVFLTSVVSFTLHTNPNLCTYCPEHPNFIIPILKYNETEKDYIKCTAVGCEMEYCLICRKWHKHGQCSNTTDNFKRCPKCGRITIKDGGCNHITCPCGAHWCYECGAGPFDTASKCYSHLNDAHGNYWNEVK